MSDDASIIVAGDEDGERLDVFLARHAGVSRNQASGRIRAGLVRVDEEVETKPAERLHAGELVEWEPIEAVAWELLPEDIPLTIVYEDEDLLVVNKQAGLVVHPAPGNPSGTLVNGLLARGGLGSIGGVVRPGIVHRLDKDTSGLLVVAKHDRVHQGLAEQFACHSIERLYLALTIGTPDPPTRHLDTFLARHPQDRKRYAVSEPGRGKRAITDFALRESFGEAALVACTLRTGRTHQIRVHLSSIGHPVVADSVYGGVARLSGLRDKVMAARLKNESRQLLHAAVLGFVHPASGRELRFEAPLPADMDALVGWLRAHLHP